MDEKLAEIIGKEIIKESRMHCKISFITTPKKNEVIALQLHLNMRTS